MPSGHDTCIFVISCTAMLAILQLWRRQNACLHGYSIRLNRMDRDDPLHGQPFCPGRASNHDGVVSCHKS